MDQIVYRGDTEPWKAFLALETKRYRFASLYDPLLAMNTSKVHINGVKKIREGLNVLRHGSEDFVNRYDKFKDVIGFGVAIISELLNIMFPDRFCVGNDKPSIKNNEYSIL